MTRRRVLLIAVLTCVPLVWLEATAAPPALDWPQWRGPNRDGQVTGLAPRASWPETPTPSWKIPVGTGHASPLKTPYEQNSITPIVSGGLVVYSGLDVPLTAARPVKKGVAFSLETAWTNPDGASYLSTPVLDGGRLYGLSHRKKGQWFCIDAASGRTLWLSDGRQAENAAILAGAGALFLLDTDGGMTVAAADATAFRPLRKWSVAKSATWAHPVVLDAGILVKDVDTLSFVRTR
jgi:hypothetical protein